MSKGPKYGSQRAKTAKHLRKGTEKKVKNDNPESRAKYAAKMAARANRRLKKRK